MQHSRNELLRAARERTVSPTCPGGRLTQRELAEAVNRYLWERYEQVVELDDNYIGKLERGVIRRPNTCYREAFRAVLGASSDAELGFRSARRDPVVQLDDVDRSQFLRGGIAGLGVLAAAPVAGLFEFPASPTPLPSRIGATEIEQTRTAARVFASWDHLYGGGLARESVTAQLRWSTGLLEASCPQHLRSELHSSVGYLAHTCGFMAFDSYAHDEGRRMFNFALTCAEEGEDWHLRAKVLSSMSRQSIWIGQPAEGLALADLALARSDELTPTELALLHTTRARALCKMARPQDTLTAIGTADDHFTQADPVDDPPWMQYYNAAQHAGDTGHAFHELALAGHEPSRPAAADRHATAIAGHGAAHMRGRAFSQTMLASLHMATGDPYEAVEGANAALDAGENVRSRRLTEYFHELSHHAAQHDDIGEVAALRERIRTLAA